MNRASGNAPILRCEPIGSYPSNTRFSYIVLLKRPVCLPSLSLVFRKPGTMSIRVLELIFFFYFASHIPITLFIDFQALLPGHVYPQLVSRPSTSDDCSLNRDRVVSVTLVQCCPFLPAAQRLPEVVCGGI